jgi:ribonuclease PH
VKRATRRASFSMLCRSTDRRLLREAARGARVHLAHPATRQHVGDEVAVRDHRPDEVAVTSAARSVVP